MIFASLDKFDGEALRPLLPAEVQQIAGRAGRYQSEYGNPNPNPSPTLALTLTPTPTPTLTLTLTLTLGEGLVTCLDAKDLGALREG